MTLIHFLSLYLQTIKCFYGKRRVDKDEECSAGTVKWWCKRTGAYRCHRRTRSTRLPYQFHCGRKKMLGLIDFSLSLNHIVKGTRIIEAIMEFVPDVNIEDLPIPYCAVATDLKAGREVMFRKGSLFKAIRASISLPSFYEPVTLHDMILIDGGIINPLPLNRVKRQAGDILVGVDVSGHDYKAQWDELQRLTAIQKHDKSLKSKILDMLIPDNIEFNYYTVLSRASSLMIRQNSILMAKLTNPDILVDIQMNRYGTFDFDKSEKLIAIGRQKTSQAIDKYKLNG